MSRQDPNALPQVVLINNGGGGIFSFLPIADQVPEEAFTALWATPQHVDLMGVHPNLEGLEFTHLV